MPPELILITLLILKHCVCDFHLQTCSMCNENGTYGRKGGLKHAFYHILGTLFIMLTFVQITGIFFTANMFGLVLLIEFIIHYHLDWFKAHICEKRSILPENPKFWWFFGLDQLLHYLSYVGIVWYLL